MRFLNRLGYDVAQRHMEIFAVMLAAAVAKHRKDRADSFLEHLFLGFHVAAERLEFGYGSALAHPEFTASAA